MATPAALPPLPFNPGRVRSYLLRLPLFTRLVLLVIFAFWLLELQTIWGVVQWGALIPNEINFGTSMRYSAECLGITLYLDKNQANMLCSVPTEHLSYHSYRFLPCNFECCGVDTSLGTV